MNKTKTRERYRNWIRSKKEPIYKSKDTSKHKDKGWRINQNHIRETFMEEYSYVKPAYMITRSYYDEQDDRESIVVNNRRMNDVIDDFFNPRGSGEYYITKDHFIERHKDKLVKKSPYRVLDTLMQEYEMDWCVEVKRGGFHVHTLVGPIDDKVIDNPNSRIRKSVPYIYGIEQYPYSLRQDDEGRERIKMDLLEYAIRGRCDFVGNSRQGVDITPVDECKAFDGYSGWRGMVAYVTKTIYNVDMLLEVYDDRNSDIL